ncbi:hypothetical protein CIB48_g5674 [Xylaria polymorpha]|nr:hypothetical protein CIB48_g5674 [Xylaria polymorpha]
MASTDKIQSLRETLIPFITAEEAATLAYPPDALPGARDVETFYGTMRVYEWGPADGGKVLFVHGDATPCLIFAKIAQGLVDPGFRVMLFGGHGFPYSNSEKIAQTILSFWGSKISMNQSSSLDLYLNAVSARQLMGQTRLSRVNRPPSLRSGEPRRVRLIRPTEEHIESALQSCRQCPLAVLFQQAGAISYWLNGIRFGLPIYRNREIFAVSSDYFITSWSSPLLIWLPLGYNNYFCILSVDVNHSIFSRPDASLMSSATRLRPGAYACQPSGQTYSFLARHTASEAVTIGRRLSQDLQRRREAYITDYDRRQPNEG